MRIKDIINEEPYVFYPEDSLLTASNFMKQERVRNVPVIDKSSSKLIGLITLREIIDAAYSNLPKPLVKDAMIKEISTVMLETPLRGAIEVMLVNRYGCLPVVDSENKLLGIVTETDLLKTLHDVTKLPEDFYKYYNVK